MQFNCIEYGEGFVNDVSQRLKGVKDFSLDIKNLVCGDFLVMI
ncbi:MAG: hypothetical protein AB8U25_03650 [Rickettsiales endosymbiont of Dermacentor nuttalli]